MTNLEAFIEHYIVCLLWSETDHNDEPFDDNYDESDLAESARKEIESDCKDFVEANEKLLSQAGNDEQNGHDFCLTRNGHGAGFWDRGYKEIGEKLSEACKPYGSQNLYVGDDGKLYV